MALQISIRKGMTQSAMYGDDGARTMRLNIWGQESEAFRDIFEFDLPGVLTRIEENMTAVGDKIYGEELGDIVQVVDIFRNAQELAANGRGEPYEEYVDDLLMDTIYSALVLLRSRRRNRPVPSLQVVPDPSNVVDMTMAVHNPVPSPSPDLAPNETEILAGQQQLRDAFESGRPFVADLPIHRTEANSGGAVCATCDGGGCPDCTDPA